MQPTLATLARRLDPSRFCQVSRTVVVQLDAVREARPFADGTGEVLLSNGQTVPVTRRRWRVLVDKLENG
jgi:DNA-binding LytR/AlgR family response regulator